MGSPPLVARMRDSSVAVVVVFLLTRLFMGVVPFGLTGYPDGHLVINDVTLYTRWGTILNAGYFPALDPMWQYPPLAAPLFMLSAATAEPAAAFVALAFLADAVAMVALLLAAQRTGRFAGAWLWAFAALVVGPVFLTRFDVFPTAAVMLGLLLAARRPAVSGALIGLGTALKVWPLLALAAIRRRSLPVAIAGFALVVLGSALAMQLWFGARAWSFLSGQSERGLQIESVAALPFVVAHAFGANVPAVFRYGSMELDVAGAGTAATIATVLGAVVLCVLAWARLAGRLERVPGADVAFAAVAVSVAASRVFSPQYSIWLVGILAVCLVARRTAMGWPTILIIFSALITQIVYPPLYAGLINGYPDAVALQVVRIVAVVAATSMAVVSVLRGNYPAAAGGQPDATVNPSTAPAPSTRTGTSTPTRAR